MTSAATSALVGRRPPRLRHLSCWFIYAALVQHRRGRSRPHCTPEWDGDEHRAGDRSRPRRVVYRRPCSVHAPDHRPAAHPCRRLRDRDHHARAGGGRPAARLGWPRPVSHRDPHVPLGLSGWELGTGEPPREKAQRDYRNRVRHPCGVDPATTTFVEVTARAWDGRKTWRDARRAHGVWADVRIYDATDLELWMERVPSAHVRISKMLGREPRDARTPDA